MCSRRPAARWSALGPELLGRIASASDEGLRLRLVCKQWAQTLANGTQSAALLPAADSTDLLHLAPTERDVAGISAFRHLRRLNISGLPGKQESPTLELSWLFVS